VIDGSPVGGGAAEAELLRLAADWDRAMTANDPVAIGSFMADDWVIIGTDGRYRGEAFLLVERVSSVFIRDGDRWRCVSTHLSNLAEART